MPPVTNYSLLVTLLLLSGSASAQSSARSGGGRMMSDDLKFYHDQTGLSTGKDPFLAAIKQNICGKVERTLVPGSLEVYPLKGYGALEIGVHRFHQAGHPEDREGEAKFVTLPK